MAHQEWLPGRTEFLVLLSTGGLSQSGSSRLASGLLFNTKGPFAYACTTWDLMEVQSTHGAEPADVVKKHE